LITISRRQSLVGGLLLVLPAGCGAAPGLDQLARGETGRVVRVLSGSVLVLDNGLNVRLAGIEAPDRDDPGAESATAELNRLAAGREVTLFYGGARRDAYGRALAQVRRREGRVWLQRAMLGAGQARVRTYADNRALARPMLEAEAGARQARRGLWVDQTYAVRLADEAAPGFQIVEGRLSSVRRLGDDTVLSFSRGRVTAFIPARAGRDFANAGIEPASLTGRLVRIRGQVRSDFGLRLDHPEALELLVERH
jgi:micrococcal nuclease